MAGTRRTLIAQRLEAGSPVVAGLLAGEFGVSEDAIRRDLRALAAEGRCRRTYGGALPLSPVPAPMLERAPSDRPRKAALARAAARLVEPEQTVFLDSGSSNLALATVLAEIPGLTIATNAVLIAAELMRWPAVTTVLLGGAVDPAVGGCVDAGAAAALRQLRFDCCFVGACALSREDGVAAFHYADAAFKRELRERSAMTAVLALNEKFETRAPYGVMALDVLDHLVIEHDLPAAQRTELAAVGPRLTIAEPPR